VVDVGACIVLASVAVTAGGHRLMG
jgi:hypothetical protein